MEFFELKKIIASILLPLPFCLLLGLAGLLTYNLCRAGIFLLMGIFFSFRGVFITAFAPVSEGLIQGLEKKHLVRKEFPKESFLYIMVLGGGLPEYEGLSALENPPRIFP